MGNCFSNQQGKTNHKSNKAYSNQNLPTEKSYKNKQENMNKYRFNCKAKDDNAQSIKDQTEEERDTCSVQLAQSINFNNKKNQRNSKHIKNSLNQRESSKSSTIEKNDGNYPEFLNKLHRTSTILQVDQKSQYGIKNLPQIWISQLRKSEINPQQIRSNPRALIDVITAFQGSMTILSSAEPQRLITSTEFQNNIDGIEFKKENPNNQWQFKELLGKGYDCEVFRVIEKCKKNEPRTFAVRVFDLVQNLAVLAKIRKQIAVIKLCSSRNIIDYEFAYMFQNKVYMFINYMNGGSITHFIKKVKNQLTQDLIAYLLKEILIGLRAIHKNQQIHRDIKSDNILINQFAQIKITDFGHAIQLTPNNKSPKQAVGTPAWMAPQLIKREVYNQSVDIWSLGILALQIALGQPPYLKMNQLKAMYEILSKPSPKLPENFSPQFKKFVTYCLQKNPNSRLNAQQLLQTSFIKNINDGIKQKIKLKELVKLYSNKKVNIFSAINFKE